jgi:hypothetical protein
MPFNLLTAQACSDAEQVALYCSVDSPLSKTMAAVILAGILTVYWFVT